MVWDAYAETKRECAFTIDHVVGTFVSGWIPENGSLGQWIILRPRIETPRRENHTSSNAADRALAWLLSSWAVLFSRLTPEEKWASSPARSELTLKNVAESIAEVMVFLRLKNY